MASRGGEGRTPGDSYVCTGVDTEAKKGQKGQYDYVLQHIQKLLKGFGLNVKKSG